MVKMINADTTDDLSINYSFRNAEKKDIDDMMQYVLFEDPWKPTTGPTIIRLENKSVEKRFEDIKIAIEEHEHTTTR